MFDALFPEAADQAQQAKLIRPPAAAPEAGTFKNVVSGSGTFFMRSMAEAGRAVSMAGAALPVLNDLVHGGTTQQDEYFAAHDETFQRAVDYWTPQAGEVGVAGQVIGSVAGGLTQFLASAPLMVTTAMMSTAEDLVRKGVDAKVATGAGVIAGAGTVAGVALPILGKTLAQKVATGVVGNVGQGAATAGATSVLLNANDVAPDVVAQFDPFDPQARTIDALMGAAFGVASRLSSPKRIEFTPEQKDALLLLNQARHMELSSLPGKPASPADLATSVRATRDAIDQILTGKPVSVTGDAQMLPDPVKDGWRSEIEAVVRQEMGDAQPIPRPEMSPTLVELKRLADAQDAKLGRGEAAEAAEPAMPRFADDVRVPTGEFDTAGQPVYVSANDYVARAQAEVAQTKATAQSLYMTAAECLLGAL